jgi:glycosyltransferase 2 family protein
LFKSRNINYKKYFVYLKLIIFCISIYILLKTVDMRLVVSYLRDIPLTILIVILPFNIFRSWLTGLRWSLLNPDISGQLSRWDYFRLSMIAFAYNLIMPGALGGDFVKAALTMNTVKNRRIDNIIAILVDRFIGFMSIIIMGNIALAFSRNIPQNMVFYLYISFAITYTIIIIFIIVITNSYLLTFFKTIVLRLGKTGIVVNHSAEVWSNVVKYFIKNWKKVIFGLLICVPIHLISFLTAFILARTLNIQITFVAISLIISLVWVISAIPITLGGAGIRELSLIYFFSMYGIAPEPVTALAAYIYIIVIMKSFIGLLFIVDWRNVNQTIILKLKERSG